jgi:uncharacterized delta-60 repeat protein
MQRIARIGWMAALALANAAVLAVDGEYDADWANGGRLAIDVSPDSDAAEALLIQADGKLVLAGDCGIALCVTRLLASGSYDATFGPIEHPGRVIIQSMFGGDIFDFSGAAVASEGGVVLAGNFHDSASTHSNVLVKLNAQGVYSSGRLDLGIINQIGYRLISVAASADGKIMLLSSQVVDALNVIAVTRVHADLSGVDFSFGDSLGTKVIAFDASAAPKAVAIQPDGKIVVVGFAGSQAAVLRLLPNGQLDDDPVVGFGDGGRAQLDWGGDATATAVKVEGDGSLLIAGYTSADTGLDRSFNFVVNRLTARGQQHPDFGPCPPPVCNFIPGPVRIDIRGLTHHDYPSALAVQSDRKILVGGKSYRGDGTSYFSLARLGATGDLDPDFGSNGHAWGYYGTVSKSDDIAAIVMNNGGIMIAGRSQEPTGTNYRFGIANLKLRSDEIFTAGFE